MVRTNSTLFAPAGLVLVVWWFARRKAGEPRHLSRAVIAGVAFLLIFTWDEIVGHTYFYVLCTTEGGGKVFKSVELSGEYWSMDGKPKFVLPNGNIELTDRYSFKTTSDEKYSKLFRIKKNTTRVMELNSNQLLATYTVFFYFGGWLTNSIALHVTGKHCPKERGGYTNFLLQVFQRPKINTIRR